MKFNFLNLKLFNEQMSFHWDWNTYNTNNLFPNWSFTIKALNTCLMKLYPDNVFESNRLTSTSITTVMRESQWCATTIPIVSVAKMRFSKLCATCQDSITNEHAVVTTDIGRLRYTTSKLRLQLFMQDFHYIYLSLK